MYARELDRAEDEGPAGPGTESAAPMDKEQADAEPLEELEVGTTFKAYLFQIQQRTEISDGARIRAGSSTAEQQRYCYGDRYDAGRAWTQGCSL